MDENSESTFMMKYHDVDANYNKIIKSNNIFRRYFDLKVHLPALSKNKIEILKVNGTKELVEHNFKMGKNSFTISITIKMATT